MAHQLLLSLTHCTETSTVYDNKTRMFQCFTISKYLIHKLFLSADEALACQTQQIRPVAGWAADCVIT